MAMSDGAVGGIFVTNLRCVQAAGLAGVGLLVFLSLVPGAYRPHTGAPGNLEHLLAYGLTATALALGWRSPSHVVGIILGLFVLACGLEVAQIFVPGRSAAWGTALVSGFGGLCGVLLAAGLLWAAGPQRKDSTRRGPAPARLRARAAKSRSSHVVAP
jgi:hypothetical protein